MRKISFGTAKKRRSVCCVGQSESDYEEVEVEDRLSRSPVPSDRLLRNPQKPG